MMDLLNLATGGGELPTTPGMPEQISGPDVADVTTAPTQPAFSDALLNVVNTLMAGQVKNVPGISAGPQADSQKADESVDDTKADDSSLLRADAQQLLLDALLLPRAQPVTVENLQFAEPATAISLLQQTTAAAVTGGPAPMIAQMAGRPQAAATTIDPSLATKAELPLTPAMGVQQVAPQLMSAIAALTPEHNVQPMTVQGKVSAESTDARTAQLSTLKLDVEDSRWSQQLQRVLGERLQVQVKNQIQHATIRLDPPEMGKIDISLQIESGRVQVQINASHAEVYRALQQTSNDLRQSLTEQNMVQVNVQVSSQSGGQQQGKGSSFAEQQNVIHSATEIAAGESATDTTRREDDSVLLTV
jgi:Flagellar hook-length control protein